LVWVIALIAFSIASANSGSAENESSAPMRVTSSFVSWLPRSANSGR
jgi:hypothetical protein